MPVLIPGRLLYLATPHTASIATTCALAMLPRAYAPDLVELRVDRVVPNMPLINGRLPLPLRHHASRSEAESLMEGGEVAVTTIRHPCDLLVTWYLRASKRGLDPAMPFAQFVDELDSFTGTFLKHPYLHDGRCFWHDADFQLRYESLAEDLNVLLARLELPTVELAPHNVTANKRPWRTYYDDETFEKARRRFEPEMQIYGDA